MTNSQRIIKYIALIFGLFLAIIIITSIAGFSVNILNFATNTSVGESKDVAKSFENVRSIHIENAARSLTIKTGTSFEIIGKDVSEEFIAEVDSNGTLHLKDKNSIIHIFDHDTNFGSNITLTIPEGFYANSVEIDCGFGNISISDLSTKELEINGGAGNIIGTNLNSEKVSIDGGAGDIEFRNILFQNVDVDSGIGDIIFEGELLGDNIIDCGVGDIELMLKGNSDLYNLSIDSGLGNIYVDGKKYSDLNWNNVTAENSIEINGGVGDIDLNFQ